MLFLALTYIFSFKTAHIVFRPLRQLNLKLKNVVSEGMSKELINEDSTSSKEIGELYNCF